jgi:hypothetical protein
MTASKTAAGRGAKAGHSPAERRAARRFACLHECLVRIEGAAEPLDWPGMVYNISATGVGLALPFPALTGMVLLIEPRGRCHAAMRLRARVVRSSLKKYVWFHGCEFVTELSDEELRRRLIEFHAKPAPAQ